MCPCVRVCVRHGFISITVPRIFLKFGTKLGVKNVKKIARPDFSKKIAFWPKSAKSAKNGQKMQKTEVFDTLPKNASEDFFLILQKSGKKIALPYRTIVSPEKRQFFEFFTEL